MVDLPGDITLQAADDLGLGFAFLETAFDVDLGGQVRAEAGEHDAPQGVVRLAVTAGIEAKPAVGLARSGRDRTRRKGGPRPLRSAAGRDGHPPR